MRNNLPPPFQGVVWINRTAALPHIRLGVQPYRSARRCELGSILQKIRNHPLYLGDVESKLRQFVVGEEVQRQPLFLEGMRPQAADFRETSVEIGRLEVHLHLADFEDAEAQEILNEALQALAAGAHVAQNLALAIVQSAQLFALQEFHVTVKNGQRSFKIVGSRGQRVGSALKPLLQLVKLLQQVLAATWVRATALTLRPRWTELRVASFSLLPLRQTGLFRRCGHCLEPSD